MAVIINGTTSATIEAGTYRFNDTISITEDLVFDLPEPFTFYVPNTFISLLGDGNEPITNPFIGNFYVNLSYASDPNNIQFDLYANSDASSEIDAPVVYNSTEGWQYVYEGFEEEGGVTHTWYDYPDYFGQTITVTEDTTFTDTDGIAFATWFNANTVEESGEEEEPTPTSVKAKIQSLITKANATTGNSDTDLTKAVKSLVAGYGQGGDPWDGDYTIEGDALPDPPLAYHLTSVDELPTDAVDGSMAVVSTEFFGWGEKTWGGYSNIQGNYIWEHNGNLYHSEGESQYVLNGDTWEEKVWNGSTSVYGYDIFHINGVAYYSSDTEQYWLNDETDTWETARWSLTSGGNIGFYGQDVWYLNDKVLLSFGDTTYVLHRRGGGGAPPDGGTIEKSTDTYAEFAFEGRNVFEHNGTLYLANASTEVYYYDTETSSWTLLPLTVEGYNTLYGECFWERDGKLYYNGHKWGTYNISYVLNEETSTLETKEWNIPEIHGERIWHNGDKTYHSYVHYDGTNYQYELGTQIKNTLYSRENGEWVSKGEI